MGGVLWFVIVFLVWSIGTIKTESSNVDRFCRMGDEKKAQQSAESVVTAGFYLGLFILLVLIALIMTIAE